MQAARIIHFHRQLSSAMSPKKTVAHEARAQIWLRAAESTFWVLLWGAAARSLAHTATQDSIFVVRLWPMWHSLALFGAVCECVRLAFLKLGAAPEVHALHLDKAGEVVGVPLNLQYSTPQNATVQTKKSPTHETGIYHQSWIFMVVCILSGFNTLAF